MKLPIRTSYVRELAAQPLRPVATGALLPKPRTLLPKPPHAITRRSYSVGEKAKEAEPGGQRRLIMAACLAIPAFGVLWLRGGKQDISGAGRGANQEYTESAEGNN